jgi:hypothetical protein
MNKFLSLPITLIKQLVQSNSVPKDWVVQQVAQREHHYPASELALLHANSIIPSPS